jgi:hypothetical protein
LRTDSCYAVISFLSREFYGWRVLSVGRNALWRWSVGVYSFSSSMMEMAVVLFLNWVRIGSILPLLALPCMLSICYSLYSKSNYHLLSVFLPLLELLSGE